MAAVSTDNRHTPADQDIASQGLWLCSCTTPALWQGVFLPLPCLYVQESGNVSDWERLIASSLPAGEDNSMVEERGREKEGW